MRGLHFQNEPHQQDKLVRVVNGEIYDVVVDIRKDSQTYGCWHGKYYLLVINYTYGYLKVLRMALSPLVKKQLFYITTDYYHPESEETIKYNDPDLNKNGLLK